MKGKRPLAILAAVAMLASVFAVAPAAAASDDCTQTNSALNALNVNTDTNVNALNVAANVPVLSPNTDGSQSASAVQSISDSNDAYQSQSNEC